MVTATSMKLSPKLLLAVAFTLAIAGRVHSHDVTSGHPQADIHYHASASSSIPILSERSASGNRWGVTRYATAFDGDHSLESATVAEQVFARYTLYVVRLQFASGAEQSIAVTAPPGRLQPEMHDMSGDSVPNDLVLASRLLRLPLVVLLNEGHDHLTVANSPGSLGSDEGQASGSRQAQRALATAPSALKLGQPLNGGK